jgi:hypothetical protein
MLALNAYPRLSSTIARGIAQQAPITPATWATFAANQIRIAAKRKMSGLISNIHNKACSSSSLGKYKERSCRTIRALAPAHKHNAIHATFCLFVINSSHRHRAA